MRISRERSMRIVGIVLVLALSVGSGVGNGVFADDKPAEQLKPIAPAKSELTGPVDFAEHVLPILEANCIACHNVAIMEGKLNLEEVPEILKGGKHGPAVVPKKPEESLLYQLASRAKQPVMPPLPNDVDAHVLTAKEVGVLQQWILEGAAGGAGAGPTVINWRPLPADVRGIFAVALSPSSRFAAAGRANQIQVYDVQTKQDLGRLLDPSLQSIVFEGQPMYPRGAAHRDFVHSLAFSPQGDKLASGGYRNVKIWERQPFTPTLTMADIKPGVAAAISADGQKLAFGTADGKVHVRDAAGKSLQTLSGHEGRVTGVAFLSKAQQLVSVGADKTIRVWNLADGKPVFQLETPAEIHDVVVSGNEELIVTAHEDKIIRSWSAKPPEPPMEDAKPDEAAGAKPVLEFKGHTAAVRTLALVPSNGTQIVSGSDDKTVRHWDLGNARLLRSMSHGGPVTDVAVRPDGKLVAATSSANTVRLWTLANGKQEAEMQDDFHAAQALLDRTTDKTVADQRQKLAETSVKTAEKNVTDREAGLKSAQEAVKKAGEALKDPQKKVADAKTKLDAAKKAFEAKKDDKNLEKQVATAQKAFDDAESALNKLVEAEAAAKRSVELAEKSVTTAKQKLDEEQKQLETAKAEVATAVKNLEAAQKQNTDGREPQVAIAFSADNSTLYAATAGGNLRVWDAEKGTPLDSIKTGGQKLTAIVAAADQHLVTVDEQAGVHVWSTRPNWKLTRVLGAADKDPLDVTESPLTGRALAVAFSPDGEQIAVGSGDPSRSGEIVFWNVDDGKLVRKIEDAHSDTVLGLEYARRGDQVVSSGADKFVKIFTVADGKLVRSFEGHTHHVLDVTWRADGSRLASAGADDVVKVWNVETGEQVTTITGYGKQVTSIQYLGTGDNIVSTGGDKAVRMHTASNRRQYRTLSGATDYMYSVAASGDETIVIAGGEDGVLRVWDGKTGQSLVTFEPTPLEADPALSAAGN